MLKIAPEGVDVEEETACQKDEQQGGEEGPRQLTPTAQRQRVFHAPAKTADAERQTPHGGGQTAETMMKRTKHGFLAEGEPSGEARCVERNDAAILIVFTKFVFGRPD